MNDILIALIIAIIAGTIDVTPIIRQKPDKFVTLSAYFHWDVLRLIIPSVNLDIQQRQEITNTYMHIFYIRNRSSYCPIKIYWISTTGGLIDTGLTVFVLSTFVFGFDRL